MTALPIELLGVFLPRGTAVHLYDVEGDRTLTLCKRRIGVNPRYLGLGWDGPQVSADRATCRACLRKASTD